MKNTIDIIIENTKRLRLERGWNKTKLAEEAGVDPSYISRLESGGRGLTIDSVEKIAFAFGVKTYELLQPNRVSEYTLREKLAKMEELDTLKKMMLEQMIDAFLKEREMDQ